MKSRWRKKRKRWLDKRSRQLVPTRKIAPLKNYSRQKQDYNSISKTKPEHVQSLIEKETVVYKATPPTVFSLIENTEETIKFFNALLDTIKTRNSSMKVFVDSSNVQRVTVDALIYLHAIICNDNRGVIHKCSFSGNYPVNELARRDYINSGFNDHVISNLKKTPPSTDVLKFVFGSTCDAEQAKNFNLFVIDKLGKNREQVISIQKVLIELMSNVYHHAYGIRDHLMLRRWYIYAEYSEAHVKVVFVDTGFGIIKTVRRKFFELLREKLGGQINDAKILESVFKGDFLRSATNQSNRGNGLNTVMKCVHQGPFNQFEVLSGRGRCIIPPDENEQMQLINYRSSLEGTIFMFDIE